MAKNPFDSHELDGEQAGVVGSVREQFKRLHESLLLLPICRERSLAITNLEQACMWAIQGIERQDDQTIDAPQN